MDSEMRLEEFKKNAEGNLRMAMHWPVVVQCVSAYDGSRSVASDIVIEALSDTSPRPTASYSLTDEQGYGRCLGSTRAFATAVDQKGLQEAVKGGIIRLDFIRETGGTIHEEGDVFPTHVPVTRTTQSVICRRADMNG